MPGLGDNILSLARLKLQRATAMANLAEPLRLTLVAPGGGNPGELRMLTYVPPGLAEGSPLVVVLHGCTQNAAAYDRGAGWSALAERHGFALLFPEQQRGNNPNLCFNWFNPEDTTRGHGEVESIRAMVVQMLEAHRLDGRRVFVTGLSAGGAMTAAMLATAPELFAGGAVIAGLPHGAAGSMQEAFSAMGQVRRNSARGWGELVRGASAHRGPWPSVQVWQGSADTTVNPGNAEQLVLQWTDVHGVEGRASSSEEVDGARHESWVGADGRAVVERWTVPGLGHGTPVGTAGVDADQLTGVPGPHMLASTIGSTWHLARSWGLLTQAPRVVAEGGTQGGTQGGVGAGIAGAGGLVAGVAAPVGSMIDKALRAAGLLK